VVVQQRQDAVTLELIQGWDRYALIRPETTLERLEPDADQTVEHVWMMLRGPGLDARGVGRAAPFRA
jgi:hypothetical protein